MNQPRAKQRLFIGALLAIALVLILAVTGACYQIIASRSQERHSLHPRQLVSAGALRLNLHCIGQGSPTVVLEAGLGDSIDTWERVQPGIARFTRVCSYDRAGYGYSDPGPMPRTADRIASELHLALQSAAEKPPYLLVGESFGGYCVRVFNGMFAGEVTGLVLVDSTQEDQYRLLPQAWMDAGTKIRRRAHRQAFWAPLYIGLGIARVQLLLQGQSVPPILLQSKYLKARASELENIEVSAEQARKAGHIQDKALLVLTAGQVIDASLRTMLSKEDQKAYEDTWTNNLQARLTNLSRYGRQIVIAGAGHDIAADRPDAIIAAVRQMCGH